MRLFTKNISEDISLVELFDENGDCQKENGTCDDMGCNIGINIGISGNSCEKK